MFFDVSRDQLLALPRPETDDGMPRKVGIEIEIGGLEEGEVADIVAAELGGSVEAAGGSDLRVTGSALGDIEVYLDIRFREKLEGEVSRIGLELARQVVPVEIVTEPVLPGRIADLDALARRLARAGASGTEAGMLLGFGVHLNVALAGTGLHDVLDPLTAFALLEDLIRREDPINNSRRLLPFTDPYPRRFVDRLAGDEIADLDAVVAAYLEETPTRNRSLDMLPILAHLRPSALDGLDLPSVSARPAFHYRLPDCRIDDPDWSLTYEWNRWVAVERVAEDADLLDTLRAAWRKHRAAWTTRRKDWAETVDNILAGARAEAGGTMP